MKQRANNTYFVPFPCSKEHQGSPTNSNILLLLKLTAREENSGSTPAKIRQEIHNNKTSLSLLASAKDTVLHDVGGSDLLLTNSR